MCTVQVVKRVFTAQKRVGASLKARQAHLAVYPMLQV